MRYPLAGASVNFTPMVLQRSLASTVPGAVSAFSVAQQIIGMLFTVTLRSVNVASHPVVSRHAARQETEGVVATLRRSVKLCALIGSAIFVFTVALNREAVAVIANLKSFSQANADLLCGLLTVLALVLPVNGLVAILRSPHYAFGKPKIPAMHMIAMGAVHICLQLALFRPFGVKGIAAAQVAWVWISVVTIFMVLPNDCKGVFTYAAGSLAKTVALAVCVGLGLYYARSHIAVEILDASRASLLARLFLFVCATAALLLVLFRTVLFGEYREFSRNTEVTERGEV
jgi:peptidoglycan biosynthesis protein MviN/MurJ (putative lipid II flippase)